jgi:hypothetical protein
MLSKRDSKNQALKLNIRTTVGGLMLQRLPRVLPTSL